MSMNHETFQTQTELITVQEVLESMTPSQLLELKRDSLAKLSEIESLVHNINDVLGGYGADVEIIG
jgi:hypothetical protein